jgi:hypothetical protein
MPIIRGNTRLFSRPLKAYAFDPTQGKTLGNYMTINLDYEDLLPGPIGKHLMVIDYDASNKCYYAPVDLDDPVILLAGGLDPSETNPQFHQQMVFAVASETIRRFEFALGRRIKWRFQTGSLGDPHRKLLRIFPHAMQEANAFYSRELRALVFGYFTASGDSVGSNLPGQTVFTCLSHDIVAHETTHALIDGLRRYFNEATGPDSLAFHEAFADIVALFQHFSFKEALLSTIQRTGGFIHQMELKPELAASQPTIQFELATVNPLVGLARQFGDAMGLRGMLRSALGTPPNSRDLDKLTEPHARGSILVAAVFDAFFTVYLGRVRDLLRIGRASGADEPDNMHPDLVNRLAEAASKVATHFSNICIRALDHCPPVGIQFGDFLRALITADADLVPDDPLGYRGALIDAFRSRGIRPRDVFSYSEESLLWNSPEQMYGKAIQCSGLVFDGIRDPSPEIQRRNASILHRFADQNRKYLGLSSHKDKTGKPTPISVHSFHPLIRVGPDDGLPKVQFFVEFIQSREEPIDPTDKKSKTFTFHGGSTVVFDQDGCVRYSIQKNLDNKTRLKEQSEYLQQMGESTGQAMYLGKPPDLEHLNFAAIHRGF